MPIDIRGRLPTARVTESVSVLDQYLQFYTGRAGEFDPEVLVQAARDQEQLGFDSTLFPQRATGPAVWPVVGWALAATRTLNLVAAHRAGLERPTTAARTVATLDRLSNGRLKVHFLQGREEADMQRDGVFHDKAERYARAHEYLDIFQQELTAVEPFDYSGQYYQVEGARSDVLPVQKPWPVLSIPGTSDAGVALAAKYADVYSVPIATLETARRAIGRITPLARKHGRSLDFWGDANIIIAATDEQAWGLAHALGDAIEQRQREAAGPLYDHGNARAALAAHDAAEHVSDVWYPRLNALTGHGYTFVGSPQTLARHLLQFYRLGVSVITLGGIANRYGADAQRLDDPEQAVLLKELIQRLHAGAAEFDQQPLPAEPLRAH